MLVNRGRVDGFCIAHSGRLDMKAIGRKGGSVGKGNARLRQTLQQPTLRAYLRENVSPAEVWTALKAALEGQNETARVSASRVLLDALHEPEREREQEQRLQLKVAAEEFSRRIAAVAERRRVIRLGGLRDARGEASLAEQYADLLAGNDPLAVEIERLREIERKWDAFPEHVREEFAA